jgi:malonyl-CoA/methylmalonyl-CoA synthetase
VGSDNLFSALRAAVRDPQRACVYGLDGPPLSYAELWTRSARFAQALRAAGVQPGDRVAVQVDKSLEAVLLYLAVLRAGAVHVPLNSAYTVPELSYFIGDAQPALLVCTPQARAALTALVQQLGVPRCLTLGADGSGSLPEAARPAPGDFEDVPRRADELAAILYTSGTTGRSKGAMLSHGNLWSNAQVLRDCWRFTAADVLLHALPIFHIHGLFVAINVTLAAGASMMLLPRFDPEPVLQALRRATVMMGVPTFYVRLLKQPGLDRQAVQHVRLFVSGSAPLLPEIHRQWQQRTGHVILERYGMSETGMNTSNPYEGERVAGSVGPPLPGVQLRVVDAHSGAAVARGQVGMIEVRGPNVFRGYWRNPAKTQAEFRDDGFFITGDLGRIDERGYVFIVGRAKDLVISGGYNVYPREIELELDALEGVAESAVFGVPHADFGEGVTAVVVAVPGAVPSEAAMLAQLRARLAAYKLPKRVLLIDELPRNALGKVQKNLLRERYAGLYAAPSGTPAMPAAHDAG